VTRGAAKPLGGKAYGSIAHMPGSKRGPGDHGISEQQAAIVTDKRPSTMRVYAQEKLDGTCMVVAKTDGRIVALGRKGHPAESAPYEHMRLFASWVAQRASRFARLLNEGERVAGEWLLMTTSIRYRVLDPDALFVAFDIMREQTRAVTLDVEDRCNECRVDVVGTLGVEDAFPGHFEMLERLERCRNGDIETDARAEGIVYRVERKHLGAWESSFLAKWTRPDFEAGSALVGIGANPEPIWNENQWSAAHASTVALDAPDGEP
jgi:hypothetical protein